MDRGLKSKRLFCQEHQMKRYGRYLEAVDAAKGQFKCKADSPCHPSLCPDCRAVVPAASAICMSCGKLVRPIPADRRTVIVSRLPARFRLRRCKQLQAYMEKWGPVRRVVPKRPNRAAVVFETAEAARRALMVKHETKDGTMWATVLKKGSNNADAPLASASQRRRLAKEEAFVRQQTAAEKLRARRRAQNKRNRQRRRTAAKGGSDAVAPPKKEGPASAKKSAAAVSDKAAELPKKVAKKKKVTAT